MFGVSFTELTAIVIVALIVVGPQKLPGLLRTLGEWIHKLRRLTTEVRAQTGIDQILREEGFHGGLNELRSMLRGDIQYYRNREPAAPADPYRETSVIDETREYPLEGPDSYSALPDDLVPEERAPELASAAPEGEKPIAEIGTSTPEPVSSEAARATASSRP